ncbi:dipeptidyl-peptidase 5 [Duganella qianjiadongensis]|uniref:Prolyl oligopeptidase family serine peptidase n=1 Tax=Duganella qianjiadongensis TaxID=2692176 RepID=A0ABW9VQG3_9BURK|nr:prolyl oligopeptidase family serine peptidase [Duganella qianjiadongensis]MYM41811.1 prolyl oligopeptidase family serine peptidase [Duganella qianjiadongensis]
MSNTILPVVPYGVWPSTISAAQVAAGATPLSGLMLGGADGCDIFWLAGKAAQGGRNALLRYHGVQEEEVTPMPYNVRSRVHEYGGGAYAVDGATVYFSHFADNRLYRLDLTADVPAPQVITAAGQQRFADLAIDRQRGRLIAVRELHGDQHSQPHNSICAIAADGSEQVLVQGADFYSSPRIAPDGSALAWLSWDHPAMPWQGTTLWLATFAADGTLDAPRRIAGSREESICQPEWSPDGLLHFVSDRSGWWNLYRLCRDGQRTEGLCPMEAEFATPHWTFGNSMYGFRSASEIICTYIDKGVSHLARLLPASGKLEPIAHPYAEIRELRVAAGYIAMLAGSPTIALELARIDFSEEGVEILAQSIAQLPDEACLSVPASISYPSAGGRTAHAFFYPPCNPAVQAPEGSQPPVIVISHGGPTGMTVNTLKLVTQYWTSRGFGVLDVNYGGSTGFGRAYRDLLKGQWGVIDVEDCVAGAQALVARGLADQQRLIIRGSSAGGLTTLCALTFHDTFKLGASYYGVSDLAGLDADSHKFESHYNEYLIAPQPAAAELYKARSPIHHTDKLSCPMIFFQGLDDKVVPPQQSAMMVQALKARGVPVAYVELEGEGHGFRKADTIIRTLEAELYFYQRMFGLHDASAGAPVQIANLTD